MIGALVFRQEGIKEFHDVYTPAGGGVYDHWALTSPFYGRWEGTVSSPERGPVYSLVEVLDVEPPMGEPPMPATNPSVERIDPKHLEIRKTPKEEIMTIRPEYPVPDVHQPWAIVDTKSHVSPLPSITDYFPDKAHAEARLATAYARLVHYNSPIFYYAWPQGWTETDAKKIHAALLPLLESGVLTDDEMNALDLARDGTPYYPNEFQRFFDAGAVAVVLADVLDRLEARASTFQDAFGVQLAIIARALIRRTKQHIGHLLWKRLP